MQTFFKVTLFALISVVIFPLRTNAAPVPLTVYVTMGNTLGCGIQGRGNFTDFRVDPEAGTVSGVGEAHAGSSKESMTISGTMDSKTGALKGSISGTHTYADGDELFTMSYSGTFEAAAQGDTSQGWKGPAKVTATSVVKQNTYLGSAVSIGMVCDETVTIENTDAVNLLADDSLPAPSAALASDDIDNVTKAEELVAESPDQIQTVDVNVNGKVLSVAITGDPSNTKAMLYTTDGVHFSNSLAGAMKRSTGAKLLDGVRSVLSGVSPFNWFGSTYSGDDKALKFKIGRALVYRNIDEQQNKLVSSLKYLSDFQSGLAAYIDLRESGTTAEAILQGDQDIDMEIERLTSRLRISVQGKQDSLSDEDKAKLDAAQKVELYQTYENGFSRYRAAKALQK